MITEVGRKHMRMLFCGLIPPVMLSHCPMRVSIILFDRPSPRRVSTSILYSALESCIGRGVGYEGLWRIGDQLELFVQDPDPGKLRKAAVFLAGNDDGDASENNPWADMWGTGLWKGRRVGSLAVASCV
ncbi:hypothetical protein BGX38DRAFT_1139178 [Terfezia claveryi]|nr:hypothetical protein BGX38DRAFT_1139178 [Terfezia claveryi]